MNHSSPCVKYLASATLLTALLLFSCSKKQDDAQETGGTMIQFTTNKSFGGKNEFKSNSPDQSKVIKINNLNKTQITFTCVEVNLPRLSTATLTLLVPQDATTAQGSLSGKFENGSGAATQAQLLIGSSNAGANQESYASSTGNFTITKLTDQEIVGHFDAHCINQSTQTNIGLSNGTFSGRF